MLDLLLSMSSNAILVFDTTGKILRANQLAADLFGYSVTELEKHKLGALLPQQYSRSHVKLFQSFLQGDETSRKMGAYRQVFARHKNGMEFPVDASIGKGILEGEPVLVSSLRDITAESRAEELIRSLALIPQENPNPVFRIKDNGGILFVNVSGELLMRELESDEMNKAPIAWMGYIQKALESNSQVVMLLPCREKTYSYMIMPVKEKGYVNLYAFDVTERELEKSRLALSDDILNSIGNLVLVSNSHAEIVYVSPSVKNIIGYEPQELLGGGWWEMERISGGDVEMEKDYICWAAGGLSVVDGKPYEHRVRHKDGSWRWLMLADTKGPRDLLIGIGTDITQLKQSEDALKASEARNRLAINAMDSVPYDLDYVEDRFTFMGDEIERITGYKSVELTPQKFTEILQEAYMRGKYEGLSLAEATERVRSGDAEGIWRCDFRIITKSGGVCWISDTSVQVQDENGKVTGSIGIFQDITTRKQAEMQLRAYADEIRSNNIALAEARDRALEASRVKSTFLATMSHEITTPMNAILGMTEMLLETELDEEQREFTQVVESAANHLLGILNDILDFSKIEAGKITIRPVRFKPIESAEEVIKLFLSKASEKNISLSLTTLPPIPDYLNGDDGRIRQILSNFVSNAIKFTDNDGRISVNITGSHAAADTFMITFSVQDSGAGISEALRPKLFEPFTQADPSNTRKHGGAGLGLAICKRLVELMKGEIGFESSEGNGSTFWINIPLSSDLTAMTPIISHEKT